MLHREQLDQALTKGCSNSNCDHTNHNSLFIGAKCHPNHRGVDVSYEAQSGVMQITCAVCERDIMDIAVKSEGTSL